LAKRRGGQDARIEAVCRDLRRWIARGLFNNRLPGERALAEHYGISLHVARQAARRLVEEHLLTRDGRRRLCVRAGAAERLAQRPAVRRIVMFCREDPHRRNAFAQHVAAGADRRAEVRGVSFELRHLSFAMSTPEPAIERIRAREPRAHDVGWVLTDLPVERTLLEGWTMEQVCFALVDQMPTQLRVNTVAFDRQDAVFQATEHLIGLGHRQIGCVGAVRGDSISQARQRGFRAALQKHGLTLQPQWVLDVGKDPDAPQSSGRERAARRAQQLLTRPQRPTGLVCFDVETAVCVLQVAERVGIQVPGELGVICAGATYRPFLPSSTLTRIDEGRPEHLGELAVDLLVRPDPMASPTVLLLRGHLVEGCTAGAPC
jgi:DNA-binding LacI/PurR family transcriptional regulator